MTFPFLNKYKEIKNPILVKSNLLHSKNPFTWGMECVFWKPLHHPRAGPTGGRNACCLHSFLRLGTVLPESLALCGSRGKCANERSSHEI